MDIIRKASQARNKRMFYGDELKNEFSLHKCLLHHYDVIDFTVFEFGMRVTYLVWRIVVLLLLPLLPLSLSDSITQTKRGATTFAGLIYMHVWLVLLLILSTAIEVVALAWTFIKYPTCVLVTLSHLPSYFKVMWVMYNIVCPNVLACFTMYYVFSMKDVIGVQFYLVLLLYFYISIHVSTTATPSRLAHTPQPVSLTLIHIFFTAIYQYGGGTDPQANRYVYKTMDWSSGIAALYALLWIFLTVFFHIALVFGSWIRRLIYRRLRKGKEAIMNPDPDDDISFCSLDTNGECLVDQPSPRIWIEDIPGDLMGHKRVIVQSTPSPQRRSQYCSPRQAVFHEVYRNPNNPLYPGEKRKRLIVEAAPDPTVAQRYCFAPAGPFGYPPSYTQRMSFYENAKPAERSYICHPDVSPDNKSLVYKCMPESPTQPPECFACDDERCFDRIQYSNKVLNTRLPEDYPPPPKHRAHAFVVDRGPIQTQTFICPRELYRPTSFVPPDVRDAAMSTTTLQMNRRASETAPNRRSSSGFLQPRASGSSKRPSKGSADDVTKRPSLGSTWV